MTLRQRLAVIMTQRADWYQALIGDVADRLRTTACEVVLRAGDPMPDFVLPNAEGDLVFSDDLLANGPLVIAFYRGSWCPFCNATLQALQEALPDIEAAGATLVVMSPDTGEHVAAVRDKLSLRYQVLSDVDNTTGVRFGAVYRVPDDYRAALLSYGIDLEQRHGDASWLLPLPSTFVVEQGGLIRYAKASGDVTDRTEPGTILRLLRDLSSKVA